MLNTNFIYASVFSLTLNIILVVLLILLALLTALYFLGRNLEKKQAQQKAAIEEHKQLVSILVIDKKKLKMKDSGLPKMIQDQMPKYLSWQKLPIVKAKVGPKIMTMIAEEKVFAMLPIKSEVKVLVSGIYITEIKSSRLPLEAPKKKKNILQKLLKK